MRSLNRNSGQRQAGWKPSVTSALGLSGYGGYPTYALRRAAPRAGRTGFRHAGASCPALWRPRFWRRTSDRGRPPLTRSCRRFLACQIPRGRPRALLGRVAKDSRAASLPSSVGWPVNSPTHNRSESATSQIALPGRRGSTPIPIAALGVRAFRTAAPINAN